MYKKHSLAAIIPCYNQETQIQKIVASVPDIVDYIIIIDDCSTDNTVETIRNLKENSRIVLLRHQDNQGIGGAIASGYEWARDNNADLAMVFAESGQVNLADLTSLLDPIVEDGVNYTKVNRRVDDWSFDKASFIRFLHNPVLSLLTKISSGYWHISDSQAGFTAADKKVMHAMNWQQIHKRYGYLNDLLVKLNVLNYRVRDVAIESVGGVDQSSGINGPKGFFVTGKTVIKGFFWRMKNKYIFHDFHPLVLFYTLGLIMLVLGLLFLIRCIWVVMATGEPPLISVLSMFFMFATGWQCVFFGMLLDIQDNKSLS